MLINKDSSIKIVDTFYTDWIPPVILVVPVDRKMDIKIDYSKPLSSDIPETVRYMRMSKSKHYYIYEEECGS